MAAVYLDNTGGKISLQGNFSGLGENGLIPLFKHFALLPAATAYTPCAGGFLPREQCAGCFDVYQHLVSLYIHLVFQVLTALRHECQIAEVARQRTEIKENMRAYSIDVCKTYFCCSGDGKRT